MRLGHIEACAAWATLAIHSVATPLVWHGAVLSHTVKLHTCNKQPGWCRPRSSGLALLRTAYNA